MGHKAFCSNACNGSSVSRASIYSCGIMTFCCSIFRVFVMLSNEPSDKDMFREENEPCEMLGIRVEKLYNRGNKCMWKVPILWLLTTGTPPCIHFHFLVGIKGFPWVSQLLFFCSLSFLLYIVVLLKKNYNRISMII